MTELTSSEEQNNTIIDEAVTFINETYQKSSLEMALTIGEYVFKNFFNSDPEQVSSKDPEKTVSYQKLLDHDDMGLDKSRLSRMVNVTIQEGLLKGSDIDITGLTYSHRVELLVLDDAEKLDMLKRCQDESWSTRQLRKEIQNLDQQQDSDSEKDGQPLKIDGKTLRYFEAPIKALKIVDDLISSADINKLHKKTRNNLRKKAEELHEHMVRSTANIEKLIAEIDQRNEEK